MYNYSNRLSNQKQSGFESRKPLDQGMPYPPIDSFQSAHFPLHFQGTDLKAVVLPMASGERAASRGSFGASGPSSFPADDLCIDQTSYPLVNVYSLLLKFTLFTR